MDFDVTAWCADHGLSVVRQRTLERGHTLDPH